MRASVESMMGTLSKANPVTTEAVQLVHADENISNKKSEKESPDQPVSSKVGDPVSASPTGSVSKVAVICTCVCVCVWETLSATVQLGLFLR